MFYRFPFGVHYVANMENIRHFLTRGRKTDDRGASPEAEIAVGADANFIKKPAYSVHPKVTQRKFNSGQFTKWGQAAVLVSISISLARFAD